MKLIIHDGKTEEIEKMLKLNKNDAVFVGCDEEIHLPREAMNSLLPLLQMQRSSFLHNKGNSVLKRILLITVNYLIIFH